MSWTIWKAMPSPDRCRTIEGPKGPGVYQIRNKKTKQYIQFGISCECQERMKSFFPKPYGVGTRNNLQKRNYVLNNWSDLEYRTFATLTREEAYGIEKKIKSQLNHLYNT